MQRNQRQLRFTALRQAFTLVEMLLVGAIIVILAALTLVAVNKTRASAKETKTRATIQKLDVAMQQIFEMYENKFAVIRHRVTHNYPALPGETKEETKKRQQKIATHFIRDLMRMELPQSWAEVYDSEDTDSPLGPITITLGGEDYTGEMSPLLDYYFAAYTNAKQTPSRAALLFLIIQNLNPEALEAFHGSEVAANDDGMLEFVDAWGNPIQFLRWAPAFPGSDLQPDILALAGYVPKTKWEDNKTWWEEDPSAQDAKQTAQGDYPDPMDEQWNTVSWFLYPLIYSAGPDGIYGIGSDGSENPQSPSVESGEILDPFAFPRGMPGNFENPWRNTLNHFDNIHNHRWYNSF